MALHTAYVICTTPTAPVISTQHTDGVASTWLDSVVYDNTGNYNITWSSLGLTTNPVIHIQTIDAAATGDGASASVFMGGNGGTSDFTSTIRAYFTDQNTTGNLLPDAFLIMLEDMEP